MTRLVWFRNDFRVHDNPALMHARRDNEEDCLAITFVCESQWRRHGLGDRRINLIKQAINGLHRSLEKLGIPLLVIQSDLFKDSENDLRHVLGALNVSELNYNIEYEINERHRDISVCRLCQEYEVSTNKFHDQCLLAPGEVRTQNNDPYRVYSPFRRSWLSLMQDYCPAPLGAPAPQASDIIPAAVSDLINDRHALPESVSDPLWSTDENTAHQRLSEFLDSDVLRYHDLRDLPDAEGTSRLSFHLALGILSPRQCIHTAWQRNNCMLSGGEQGIDTWINELIWREFYRHLLVAYPQLCKHRAFKPETEGVPWRNNKNDFDRWCRGETGYPIVDAAMKQLLDQGWMHNRLRMITAMFLTKHLLIDWRWGEAWFFEQLVDADLASNNGGWQWGASTGADGAPYFRIFNPTTQSEKFDKQGLFISRYLPELARLPNKSRHFPSSPERTLCKYADPVVEHKSARERALTAFKQTLEA